MTRPDATKRYVMVQRQVATLAAAVAAVGAAIAFSATAAAEPPPPPEPVPPAPANPAPPAPTGFLPPAGTVQNFIPDGGLAPDSGYDFLLGQAPVPSVTSGQAGQAPAPGTILDPQAIQALRPTNFALAGQGQNSIYSYTPAAPDAPPGGFLENARGSHGLWNYQMGKLDPSQLGQPLPGTAPPPGTNIPVGLAPDMPDPAAPPAPGVPPLPAPPPVG